MQNTKRICKSFSIRPSAFCIPLALTVLVAAYALSAADAVAISGEGGLSFSLSVAEDGRVKSAKFESEGEPLIDGFSVKIDGKPVEPVLERHSAGKDSAALVFGIGNAKLELRLQIKDGAFVDNVAFAGGDACSSFEFMWQFSETNGTVRPIPFGSLRQRPTAQDFEKFAADREGQQQYEGAFLSFGSGRQVTIIKEPTDDEPLLVRIRKEGRLLAGAAHSDAAGDKPIGKKDFHSTIYRISRGEPAERAFACHRDYMAAHGIKEPDNYSPDVNYCLFYEQGMHKKMSGNSIDKDFVLAMIGTLKALHCTMMYTDQGWETGFGSLTWDTERMGDLAELVKTLGDNGLKLGVLVGLHMDGPDLPKETFRRDKNGKQCAGDPWHPYGVCACSEAGKEIRYERLKKIADAGVKFFSFDFNNTDYFPCYSKDHGHGWPCSDYSHSKAVNEVQERLKRSCPGLTIEAHDWVNAGDHFFPIYMFPAGHHERWGFEYMWYPFQDYSAGRLENLYWYRLAYRAPMYLHMNLNGIGKNAEVLWYYASTVQHFGVGNYHQTDSASQELAKRAMEKIATVRDMFYNEDFTGRNPMVHVHRKNGNAVICMFNSAASRCGEQKFAFDELGVGAGAKVEKVWGNAEIVMEADGFTVKPVLEESDCAILSVIHKGREE